MNINDLKTNYT